MLRALTYVEIDVPSFEPESPEAFETWRFTYPCDYTPRNIPAIPSLASVSHSPATISLGKDLGTRAALSATFVDHRHIFAGEAFDSGTFWGKWRARHGMTLQGRALRWIQGLEGQTLEQMETRHFVIESTDGPSPKGVYSINAKDVLKLADGDRAQAPTPSRGFMVGAIDDNDTAFTLSPSGVGDLDYPASGYAALGGKEVVSFTRSGDVMTITRAQLGTAADSHDAGSRVQLVLRYVGEDPADIIYDLLTEYAGINPAYIPLETWRSETAAFLQQNYSANIAEPTDVSRLVSELIEQAALVVWWEPLTPQIRLQVLRPIATTAAVFSEDNTMEGTLATREQPTTRVSQVLTYFGQRDPLAPIDEERNFRSAVLTIDGDAEEAYRTPAIRKIFSRWIPFGARTVASRLNDLVLGRFRNPPRKFSMSLFRYGQETPALGGGYRLGSWSLQGIDGAAVTAPIQVTRLNPLSDRYEIEAEEMLATQIDPSDLINRVIVIDAAINNVNLREMHDSIYPDPDVSASPEETLMVYIEENVIVGSSGPTLPAFDVGSWPVGYPITIYVRGRIQGAGGKGGQGGRGYVINNSTSQTSAGFTGGQGGTGLYTRFPINLILNEGAAELWGGGGGGGGGGGYANNDGDFAYGGGGGGGGQGTVGGLGGPGGIITTDGAGEMGAVGNPGQTGSRGSGGVGPNNAGNGGQGGNAGQAGLTGSASSIRAGGTGGSSGRAIDGVSFVTKTGTGDIRGSQIN